MSTYLVFSPHLDDAVLSCGAQVAVWTELGHHVVIATVFSEGDEAHTTRYAHRRADDENAVRALNAVPVHLGFTDAPFRYARYHNFSTLLLHETLPPDNLEIATAVGLRMQALAQEVQADALYFPLAVGGHVDHLVVFEASKQCWAGSIPVNYYQDLPYALVPGWPAMRWQQHGASMEYALKMDFHPIHLQELSLAFLKNYMEDDADLQASETLHAAQVSKLSPVTTGALAWKLAHRIFKRRRVSVAAIYLQQKINAIRCYATEWPVLFGPAQQDIENTLRTNVKDYTEIYWTLNR